MLFYSIVLIALAATSLATPPPGYVKKPDNDTNPPAYEYKYEIRDDAGKGQSKEETRAGEFARGSYHVNTGQATTDVKYFVDDWGYHPLVKYRLTGKDGSTTTHLALGKHAVEALRTGGDVGPKFELPVVSSKGQSVQIIQPYVVKHNGSSDVSPTDILVDTMSSSDVEKIMENSMANSTSEPKPIEKSEGDMEGEAIQSTDAVADTETKPMENSGGDMEGEAIQSTDAVADTETKPMENSEGYSYGVPMESWGGSSKTELDIFAKESEGLLTKLIPSSNNSATSEEIGYIASTPSIPFTYPPLQEVRDIYAKNDYQHAALIDEQLYQQSAAGNFGQKVHTASVGESGIKDFTFSTTTASSESTSLTKQNGDVTYTVHSGSNVNTAYLTSAGKSQNAQILHNSFQYREKFLSTSTTAIPNYSDNGLSSVIVTSTTLAPATVTREFTSNDLASEKQEKYEYVSLGAKPSQEFSEFGPADPRLVNYGLPLGNEGPNRHEQRLETPGLSAYGTGNSLQNENEVQSSTLNAFSVTPSSVSSSSSVSSYFAKPIVVAEFTSGYGQSELSSTPKYIDDFVGHTTPAPVFSTTAQPIVSTETIAVTPKYESQSQITTSAVVLNPIQAGVALVNAGETHLISQGGALESSILLKEDVSVNSASTIGQSESHEHNRLQLEERIRQILEQQRETENRIHQVEQQRETENRIHQEEQQRETENRIHQEEQHKRVKQLQEEIQLQQVQQFQKGLQLQQNQYDIEELYLKQQLQLGGLQQHQKFQQKGRIRPQEEQKYDYQQLGNDVPLQQEVELQQVEESQQSEQLEHQEVQKEVTEQVDESQLDQNQDVHLEQQQQEELKVREILEKEELQVQQHEAQKIQEVIENQKAQQLLQQQLQYELEKQLLEYQQKQQRNQGVNSFVKSSKSAHNSGIEIQKSIEIYHNEPVQEIHYQTQVPAQVESSEIDQSQRQQQYIELQSTENTQQAYRGQVQSGGGVSFKINHVPGEQGYQLGQKDQFSLGAGSQAQQVLVAENQANLHQAYDLTPSNSLSQQSSTSNGAVLLGFRVNHEFGGRQNYQIDQHRENGIGGHEIDLQPNPHTVTFGSNIANGAYQLKQRGQAQSNSHSHSHSYESNRGQQQVVVGLPYTLEASKELVLPGIQTTSAQIINNPVFQKHASLSVAEHYPIEVTNGGENYSIESSRIVQKQIPAPHPYPVEKVIEKTVHVPQPYSVEKIIEKKVPYPVDRIVEKRIPILQPYPVHIRVPQPYPVEKIVEKLFPVETIVEKPVRIHVPVEKIIEKKVPVPQPYPVEVEKIVEKKVPYPVEVTKYIDKPVPIHVPHPYPVEKIVERIVEKPVQVRVPYAVEVVRNIPYGVHYGVSYQQIMRPHSHNLYSNHGKARPPFYGIPIVTRHQEFRHQENSGYNYDKPANNFLDNGNSNDQITAGNQQIQFKHSGKLNSHIGYQHYSPRRYSLRTSGKDKPRSEEYIGPVPPQRSLLLRHHQHSLQNQHAVQGRSPQSSTAATRSPTSTTTLRRAREPETKPQSSAGNFRQSRVEYGFKPPMIPSVQYDEKTASKVES